MKNILSTFDMSKEEFIEYMYYYVPQLNITVSEYKNDPFWIEIKLNIPKNNLCKIIVFAWKKYVIRLYDEENKDAYNESQKLIMRERRAKKKIEKENAERLRNENEN